MQVARTGGLAQALRRIEAALRGQNSDASANPPATTRRLSLIPGASKARSRAATSRGALCTAAIEQSVPPHTDASVAGGRLLGRFLREPRVRCTAYTDADFYFVRAAQHLQSARLAAFTLSAIFHTGRHCGARDALYRRLPFCAHGNRRIAVD